MDSYVGVDGVRDRSRPFARLVSGPFVSVKLLAAGVRIAVNDLAVVPWGGRSARRDCQVHSTARYRWRLVVRDRGLFFLCVLLGVPVGRSAGVEILRSGGGIPILCLGAVWVIYVLLDGGLSLQGVWGGVHLSRLEAKRGNMVIGILNRNNFHGQVIRVNFVGKGAMRMVLGTPLGSPVGCELLNCRVSLQERRTSVVRIMDRRRTHAVRGPCRNSVARSMPISRSRLITLTGNGHHAVGMTLMNGPGYKGASLFGVTSNTRRRMKGCDNIAMSTGRNFFSFRNCRFHVMSLPKACSLSTCAPRRLCMHGRVVRRAPSMVVGITSSSGLRHGFCLAARLVSVGIHVIVTLGVCSRLRDDNGGLSCVGLDRLVKIPVVPAIYQQNRNVSRLFRIVVNVCRNKSFLSRGNRVHSRVLRSLES